MKFQCVFIVRGNLIFSSFVVRLVEMEMEKGCQMFFSMATYFTIESSPAGNASLDPCKLLNMT